MNPLIEAIGSATTVAASRLADAVHLTLIADSEIAILEVPHLACRPIDVDLPPHIVRVRHWPNIGGCLENGGSDDVVVWSPSLAEAPGTGWVVPMDHPAQDDLAARIRLLHFIIKRLEQHRGVDGADRPPSARTVMYTPGVSDDDLAPVTRRFPGAIQRVPARLSEFPGGLVLTVTQDVWNDPEGFSSTLDEAMGQAVGRIGHETVRAS
ncbi:MAG: hypothetical protein GWP18_02510 [Proteobacteria bacterium]|nr:hypothetical protein [Pseudomonadota bacterium]